MAMPFLLRFETIFFCLSVTFLSLSARYSPTWESLDSRPNPTWYDEAKLGIFIHWGVFAVPSFRSEWFWWDWQGAKYNDCVDFMKANYKPDFTYADFAPQFTAEFYNSTQWAEIFKASGAKYVVLTSKHHEGFTNWPSNYSWTWNSKDVGPNRDLVGELASAIREKTDIHFGLYHSMFEWFHPLYLQDKANKFQTDDFVKFKTLPELYEIVNTYKPDVVWSDGDWEAPDTYWQSKDFMAWLYNDSPVKDTVITNDRWGSGIACHHGGVYTCTDRYNPKKLLQHKFENCMTIDKKSWGYRRNAVLQDFLTTYELITTFVETISCGGNMLMNIGPTLDGTIIPIFQQRLLDMGQWLKVNGEAVYSSKPWQYQNDTVTPNVWYTKNLSSTNKTIVYAFLLEWPTVTEITLGAPEGNADTTVELVGYSGKPFIWKTGPTGGMEIGIPQISINNMPCQWAWVLRLTGLKNA